MTTSLILFDVDGTLVDTAGAGRRAMAQAFRELFDVDGVETRTASVDFAGSTDPRIIMALAQRLEVARSTLDAVLEPLHEAYFRALSREMSCPDPRRRVLPGVPRLLGELEHRSDVCLGLVTGNFERVARAKLEPFGLNRYFPDGGFSSDHPDRQEIARLAREKLSRATGVPFPPSRVTVIGDTERDIDCARANGYRAVSVDTGWSSRERLEAAGPDALLDSLEDLPRVLEAIGLSRG